MREYHHQIAARGISPLEDPHDYAASDLDGAIFDALRQARELGLVEIHDAALGHWDYLAALTRLRDAGDLPLRVRVFVMSGIADPARMRRFGDAQLEILGVKFYADGWLGPRTCAMAEPFSDEPGNRGILFYDAETLARKMEPFAAAGWQLATHAIGDRAIAQVLDAYRLVYGDDARRHGPRVEHVQVTNPELTARFAEMGVVACVQPSFPVSDAATAKAALGPRFAASYHWSGMLDAGIGVIAGSDFPIETQDPLVGLQRLATGADLDGEVVAAALGLERAWRVMTDEASGTVTLSANPADIPRGEIHRLRVIDRAPNLG
jgi:predicted amidohydrolase YtcJ